MLIIGCDFHARYQQIAMMEEATGELTERRLSFGTPAAGGPTEARLLRPDFFVGTASQPTRGVCVPDVPAGRNLLFSLLPLVPLASCRRLAVALAFAVAYAPRCHSDRGASQPTRNLLFSSLLAVSPVFE
jgi:hypothetical protein